MKFTVRNQAQIANKFIRFAKWKINKLNRKFDLVIYSEIFVQQVSKSPSTYRATIKLGVPGPDIVVAAQSKDLNELWAKIFQKLEGQVRRYSDRKNKTSKVTAKALYIS